MSDRNDRDELEREQLFRSLRADMLEERKHDKARGIYFSGFSGMLIELNIRLRQYLEILKTYSFEQLVCQTLQDHKQHLTNIRLKNPAFFAALKNEAVAELDGRMIYIDENKREFTFEEPLK